MRRATKLWVPPKPNILRCAADLRRANFLPGWMPGAAGAGGAPGQFPIVEGTNTGSEPFGNSHNVPLPSGIQSGDLLLIIATLGSTLGAATTSAPAGWTELYSSIGANPLRRHACYFKTATGSEGATQSLSWSGASCICTSISYRISNWQGVPEDAATATGTSNSANPPSVTPSWGVAKTLWIVAIGAAGSAATATAPSNYSSQVSSQASSFVLTSTAVRELEAASEDPNTLGLSASLPWVTNTIAIQPA